MSLNINVLFSLTFLVLFAGIAILAASLRKSSRHWWFLAVGLAALVVISVLLDGTLKVILLDVAALLAVVMVWDTGTPEAKRAARNYLWLLMIALAAIAAALLLGGEQALAPAASLEKTIAILLLVGFGLKLALVPFYFWLPSVAQSAPPLTTALIVALVDMGSFQELYNIRTAAPWIFNDFLPFWLGLALLSMFGGAILALAQKDIKRMLAFSTIDDLGYLVLGIVGSQTGITGALVGALSHSVMKVLLFGAVAVAESKLGHSLTMKDRGLAARFPVAGAAFIVGALGMIGVPPTLGFVGRWRLYLSGMQQGGIVLVLAMAAATGLALIYYVRAIHQVWLGSPDQEGTSKELFGKEPLAAATVLVVLCVLVIGLGFYPGLWTGILP
ncbi:MAG: proton-conducting transporter membrane subunit [Anaerolineaceae bacterium]|nr:proton-conducting transporter membrane subunit [Anaerolineaceae bacterium]